MSEAVALHGSGIPVSAIMHNEVKRLSVNQIKWIKYYAKYGNATKAAQKAYGIDKASAWVVGSDNLRKLDYPLFMEMLGITDKALQSKLQEGLDANRVIGVNGKDATASTDNFVEVPDYSTRHKYLTTALTLKKRLEIATTTVVVDKMLVLDATGDATALDPIQPIEGTTVEDKPIA